jgi:hypothetical protein
VQTWAGGGTSSDLATDKFGLGTSNSHKGNSLNSTGGPPGVLTYFPGFRDVILLAPEVQGDDYESDNAPGSPTAYPPLADIYDCVKDDLDANYVIWQRNMDPPYWQGGTYNGNVLPGVLDFLQTHSPITSDTSGAGGLNTTMPTYLK